MGWKDAHLHEFEVGGLTYGDTWSLSAERTDDEARVYDAQQVRMRDFSREPGVTFTYVYDFGDNWRHTVTLEKLVAATPAPKKLDDQHFEVSFGNENPAADYDPGAPMRPYVLLQRQFEDEDGDVCYLETHDPDRYAGHLQAPACRIHSHPPRLRDRPAPRPTGAGHLQARCTPLPGGPTCR